VSVARHTCTISITITARTQPVFGALISITIFCPWSIMTRHET
jgi:hypothetical protein